MQVFHFKCTVRWKELVPLLNFAANTLWRTIVWGPKTNCTFSPTVLISNFRASICPSNHVSALAPRTRISATCFTLDRHFRSEKHVRKIHRSLPCPTPPLQVSWVRELAVAAWKKSYGNRAQEKNCYQVHMYAPDRKICDKSENLKPFGYKVIQYFRSKGWVGALLIEIAGILGAVINRYPDMNFVCIFDIPQRRLTSHHSFLPSLPIPWVRWPIPQSVVIQVSQK